MKRRRAPNARPVTVLDHVATTIIQDQGSADSWTNQYYSNHRGRLIGDLQLVGDLVQPEANVVEFGSAPPFLTAALAELGIAITGVDIAPGRFERSIARYSLNVLECDIESEPLPFKDEVFSCALFNELFEHLRLNPIFTMREVWRVLRPGGLLLLTTPNLRSLRGMYHFLLDGEAYAVVGGVYSEYEKLKTLGHMGHVREYTPKEVSDFLTRCGFQIQRSIFRGPLHHWSERIVCSLFPRLKPYVSIIALKPRS